MPGHLRIVHIINDRTRIQPERLQSHRLRHTNDFAKIGFILSDGNLLSARGYICADVVKATIENKDVRLNGGLFQSISQISQHLPGVAAVCSFGNIKIRPPLFFFRIPLTIIQEIPPQAFLQKGPVVHTDTITDNKDSGQFGRESRHNCKECQSAK